MALFNVETIRMISFLIHGLTKSSRQYSDMPTEMGAEAVEIITMAVDKFQAKKNYEVRALVRLLYSNFELLKSCLSSNNTDRSSLGGSSTHQKHIGQKVWFNMALCNRRRIWI